MSKNLKKGIIKKEAFNKKHENEQNINKQGINEKWLRMGGVAAAVIVIAIAVGALFQRSSIDGINPTVASVNGINISASDVTLMRTQAEDTFIWDVTNMVFNEGLVDYENTFVEDGLPLGRAIREEAVRLAAIRKLQEKYAQQIGITLTDDEITMIHDEINEFIETYGLEEFEEILMAQGITDHDHLVSVSKTDQIIGNLIQELLANPEAFAPFEPFMEPEQELELDEEPIAAKHILVDPGNFDTMEEAESYAITLLERVLAGEDFDMLIRTYGQDPGMEFNPDGYTFVSGVMVSEFEQGTRELEIGGISGLVKSDFGFHIIMRVEPNEEEVMLPWWMETPSLEERMLGAIQVAFDVKLDEATVVLMPALDDVPLGG